MLRSLLFLVFLCGLSAASIETWSFPIKRRNYTETFKFNGVTNPYVIVSIARFDGNAKFGFYSTSTVKQT